MTKTKQKQFIVFMLFCVCISFFSCNNDENMDDISKTDIDTNFVEKREAIALATMLQYDIYNELTKTRSTTYLEVDNTTPLGDGEKPSYYIINYKDNSGFVIIAGDKRAIPVLAFSTEGNFDLSQNELPGGLVEWMANTNEYIKDIRDHSSEKVGLRNNFADEPCLMTRATIIPSEDCATPVQCSVKPMKEVGPLLKTTWGQGVGYNDRVPSGNCHIYSNGKYPTGCVATALAQVMKYHKYSNNRQDWDGMLDNTGSDATAKLMRDLATDLHMKYGCDGSSAYVSDIPAVLKDWGYSSGKHKSYDILDYNLIINQLNLKLPVILGGGKNSGWGIIGIYPDGHAWVCDGYRKGDICVGNTTYSTLSLHMNWGWGTSSSYYNSYNGWFAFDNWNPNNTSYNNRKEIVYDIKP